MTQDERDKLLQNISSEMGNLSLGFWIFGFVFMLFAIHSCTKADTDPNLLDFASHWLEPVAVSEQVWYRPAENDPNLLVRINQTRVVHRLDLSDFVFLAQTWPGDPNYIPPETPTMPQDVNIPEPNEVQAITQFCFTVGGKHHLFEDCRYIVGKEYKPCLCEPDNMCLTCTARAVNP